MLDKIGGYVINERGFVHLKGKGDVRTYWLVGVDEDAIARRSDMKDLKPLFCRPRGLQALSNEQQNLRRRASPKLPGSGNVSRQASFCAGNGQNNSHALPNANNKGSGNFIRRPSFDPALLSISLKAAQQQMSTSNNAGGQNPPAPYHRSNSRESPATPRRKRRDEKLTVVPPCRRAGECSVTIEPPSDSSNAHTPATTSPIKTMDMVQSSDSVQSLPQSSTNDPKIKDLLYKKRVAFTPRIRSSLGIMRECKSLDLLLGREGVATDNLHSVVPATKVRKLSRSVEMDDTLPFRNQSQCGDNHNEGSQSMCSGCCADYHDNDNGSAGYRSSIPMTYPAIPPPGYSSTGAPSEYPSALAPPKPQMKRPTYNKNYRNQKTFQSQSNESLSCDSDERHEAALLLDPNYSCDNRSTHGDDDDDHLGASHGENEPGHISMKVNICENFSPPSLPGKSQQNKNPHWKKLSDQMEREKKGMTLAKWFHTIVNGNGIGSSGSGGKRSSVASHSSMKQEGRSSVPVVDNSDTDEEKGMKRHRKLKSHHSTSSENKSCDVPQLLENESVL